MGCNTSVKTIKMKTKDEKWKTYAYIVLIILLLLNLALQIDMMAQIPNGGLIPPDEDSVNWELSKDSSELTLRYTQEDIYLEDLRSLYKEYIKYCYHVVEITVVQNGSVESKAVVPIYDQCTGEITAYKSVPGDTIWEEINCPEYYSYYIDDTEVIRHGEMNDYSTIHGKWYYDWQIDSVNIMNYNYSCTVTKKVKCTTMQEKPTRAGFYVWLFNRIKQ